ncbi:hypothetical protein [Saccharopolyspora hattusasensis]|uniref:hypothetical protein n=1 Tax=Saccharopolyspora hattusasensis TaxID=1128679 RepID=UPI003D994814
MISLLSASVEEVGVLLGTKVDLDVVAGVGISNGEDAALLVARSFEPTTEVLLPSVESSLSWRDSFIAVDHPGDEM